MNLEIAIIIMSLLSFLTCALIFHLTKTTYMRQASRIILKSLRHHGEHGITYPADTSKYLPIPIAYSDSWEVIGFYEKNDGTFEEKNVSYDYIIEKWVVRINDQSIEVEAPSMWKYSQHDIETRNKIKEG